VKLNLGSGGSPITDDGWTNVDLYADADVKADMLDLPYEDGAVEEIHCAHALEHLAAAEIHPALIEWLRVLKPGGKLTVVVPNMDFIAAVWLHAGDRAYAHHLIFGSQEHEGEFHKSGWRPGDMNSDLVGAGFIVDQVVVQWTPNYNQESIVAVAHKPVILDA
jgi:SAM-dependent methyltransferase